MSNKEFNILEHTTRHEILTILKRIGNKELKPSGHGYEIYGPILIRDAANHSTKKFTKIWKNKPALALIMVVLAANRNYNVVVQPNLKRIEDEIPSLKSFKQLSLLLKEKSKTEFYTLWGHDDAKKYNTLKNILSKIELIRKKYPGNKDDFELMNRWGKDADLSTYKGNPIGCLRNVGGATFQHLRMVFGIDTVKPDQRVKEVLDSEFGLKRLSDIKVVKAVEQIAEIASMKVITVDQIFVKYGSSYNNKNTNNISVQQIGKNLKLQGISNLIISKATQLSLAQVERL